MEVAPGGQLDGQEHELDEYRVVFWDRTRANAVSYRLTDVRSIWEVTSWAEMQIAGGPLVDHFPEICAVIRPPPGGEVDIVRLTADYWGEVSAGTREHPESPPLDVDHDRLGID